MNIEVNGKKYDIRFRQEFVESKSHRHVRKTTATLSAIDPTKVGAEKYSVVNSVTLTQSIKDRDNKHRARKLAVNKVLHVFDKVDRAIVWENQLLPLFEPNLFENDAE